MELLQKPHRIKSKGYTAFIKTKYCVACGKWPTDPCHTETGGMGTKCNDTRQLPMCREHHDEFDADKTRFAIKYGLDIRGLIIRFMEEYMEWKNVL